VILIHQRYRRTDGQTDGRTTCNLNTALCTSASRGKNHKITSSSFIQNCLIKTTRLNNNKIAMFDITFFKVVTGQAFRIFTFKYRKLSTYFQLSTLNTLISKYLNTNSLPPYVRSCTTLTTFRKHLKSHLFQSSFPTA